MGIQQNDLYEKIAGMLAAGVGELQVAEAVGLSPGRISQIKEEEGFISVMAEAQSKRAAETMELNDGWNNVEVSALRILQRNLKHNSNPDFALRAAMVANRAQRRGGSGNVPLGAGATGGAVVINLNQQFVQQLTGTMVPKDLLTSASTSVQTSTSASAPTSDKISAQTYTQIYGQAPALSTVQLEQTTVADDLLAAMGGGSGQQTQQPQVSKVVSMLGPKSLRELLLGLDEAEDA